MDLLVRRTAEGVVNSVDKCDSSPTPVYRHWNCSSVVPLSASGESRAYASGTSHDYSLRPAYGYYMLQLRVVVSGKTWGGGVVGQGVCCPCTGWMGEVRV